MVSELELIDNLCEFCVSCHDNWSTKQLYCLLYYAPTHSGALTSVLGVLLAGVYGRFHGLLKTGFQKVLAHCKVFVILVRNVITQNFLSFYDRRVKLVLFLPMVVAGKSFNIKRDSKTRH